MKKETTQIEFILTAREEAQIQDQWREYDAAKEYLLVAAENFSCSGPTFLEDLEAAARRYRDAVHALTGD